MQKIHLRVLIARFTILVVLLSSMLVLLGCGDLNPVDLLTQAVDGISTGPSPVVDIDPRLQEYATEFEQYSAIEKHPTVITNLIMLFASTLPDDSYGDATLGVCRTGTNLDPSVFIGADDWFGWEDSAEREQLVFHEMGHCVLNRGHVYTNVIDNGKVIPGSIMVPYEIDDATYLEHRDFYMWEMFNGPFPDGSVFSRGDYTELDSDQEE